MPITKRKDKNPFAADQIVKATRTFAWEGGTVLRGETYRGNHPAVEAGWSAFVDGDVLDSELENFWNEMPPPPTHAPPVTVQSIEIPIHRRVECMVDVARQMEWAPGSPGEKSGGKAPSGMVELRRGQILDVLSEPVRRHPEWFQWPERHVLAEDVERAERLEREGG
jgi:hypothetical protein